MDEKDWYVLQYLHKEQNLTRAAEQLYMTQPALTYRLQQLEKRFNVPLFVKTGKGIRFTPEGERLVQYAKNMIAELQKTTDIIVNMRNEVQGNLRIGASIYYGQYELPQKLQVFLDKYPKVDIHVSTGFSSEVIESLLQDEIDVGIVRGDYEWFDQKHVLSEESICLVSKQEIDLQELPNLPRINYRPPKLATRSGSHSSASWSESINKWWYERYSQPPLITMQVDSFETCKEMVKHGLGYTIISIRKRLCLIAIMISLMFIGACTSQEVTQSENTLPIDRFTIEVNGKSKQFAIITLDTAMKNYMKKANENQMNLEEIYEETVWKPVWKHCFEKGEYVSIINRLRENPPTNFKRIEKAIEVLETSDVTQTIKDALIESSRYLEGPPTTNVCVLPSDELETSAAYTVGSGKILMLYNPYLYKSNEELASTVAHEYHHSAWTSKYFDPKKSFTLLDYLIFEGKAVAFQKLLYPNEGDLPVYDEAQSENRKIIQQHLHSTNFTYMQTIMFGGDRFPPVFGYSEGYRIVQTFLDKNPNLSVEEWTAIPPEDMYSKRE